MDSSFDLGRRIDTHHRRPYKSDLRSFTSEVHLLRLRSRRTAAMSRLLCRNRPWTTCANTLQTLRTSPGANTSRVLGASSRTSLPTPRTGHYVANSIRRLHSQPITTLSHTAWRKPSSTVLTRLGQASKAEHGRLYVGIAATGALVLFMMNEDKGDATNSKMAFTPIHPQAPPSEDPVYMVPSTTEERITISYLLQTYILEPISTFFRFLHLALLFGPVILTSPMLLVGSTTGTTQGGPGAGRNTEETERWGAIWWHGFLVAQMERAGPTFIKVSAEGNAQCFGH